MPDQDTSSKPGENESDTKSFVPGDTPAQEGASMGV